MKGKCQIDKGFIKVRFSHASVPTKAMVQGPKMEVTEGQEIHSVVERVGPWFCFLYVTWWRPCGCWLHLLDWPVLAAPCPTMGRLPAKFDLKPLNHTTICIYIYISLSITSFTSCNKKRHSRTGGPLPWIWRIWKARRVLESTFFSPGHLPQNAQNVNLGGLELWS